MRCKALVGAGLVALTGCEPAMDTATIGSGWHFGLDIRDPQELQLARASLEEFGRGLEATGYPIRGSGSYAQTDGNTHRTVTRHELRSQGHHPVLGEIVYELAFWDGVMAEETEINVLIDGDSIPDTAAGRAAWTEAVQALCRAAHPGEDCSDVQG